jgi:hypothetical protein
MMLLHDHENGGKVATLEESPKAQGRATAPPARWTVLAYLAGDNDLEGVLLDDLKEMDRVARARARSRSSPSSIAPRTGTPPPATGAARVATT